ncbi:MAG: universal stress protein [Microscillaceae bacterium]|jgi:nucleotide-binding universal stress UspA family protein|nr:universal stress protein [Microscillaceae bacterium]
MKKILVPTDFSPFAINAGKVAFQLARKLEGEVMLLHVIPDLKNLLLAPDATQTETTWEEKYLQQARKNALRQMNKLIEHEQFAIAQVEQKILIGNVSQMIYQEARTWQADLIVMGTHGTTHLEDFLVGSNTEKIVRNAPCPVLVVKDQPVNFMLANILFPTNLLETHLPAMAKLREFQRLFDAHIHLLFVNSLVGFLSSEEIAQRLHNFVQEAHLSDFTFHTVAAKTEEAGILLAAQSLNIDLIALITHQRRGLSHFFLGSISEDVANHALKPVLTLSIKDENYLE